MPGIYRHISLHPKLLFERGGFSNNTDFPFSTISILESYLLNANKSSILDLMILISY